MKSFVLLVPLMSALALSEVGPASCNISDKSIVGRTLSGVAQVSNMGLIQVRCSVSARPRPSRRGDVQYGLKAAVTVYKVSVDGTRKVVPSEVNLSGGGFDHAEEWVDFYIDIPLDAVERDAEARRFLANLERRAADENPSGPARQQAQEQIRRMQNDPHAVSQMVVQSRVGRFQVDCSVFDGEQVVGKGRADLEVLFKGRFSAGVSHKE